jgi:YidC/Oxa1 family membrane protein insertase
LFRLLQTPLESINPASALGVALRDGTVKTFLGMDLSTTPSEAVSIGILVAIPYLIMIVLMVATQYVQQWHATYGQERPSGQPGAGAQQAITKIMPLFIGFISWNFPAGLVLYWSTSNLFRLGQQALIFKIDGRPTPMAKTAEESKQVEDSDEGQVKKPQSGAAKKRRRRRRR